MGKPQVFCFLSNLALQAPFAQRKDFTTQFKRVSNNLTPFFVLFFDILPRLPPNVRFGGAKSETNRVGGAFCLPVNVLRSGAYAYLARRKAKPLRPPLWELPLAQSIRTRIKAKAVKPAAVFDLYNIRTYARARGNRLPHRQTTPAQSVRCHAD